MFLALVMKILESMEYIFHLLQRPSPIPLSQLCPYYILEMNSQTNEQAKTSKCESMHIRIIIVCVVGDKMDKNDHSSSGKGTKGQRRRGRDDSCEGRRDADRKKKEMKASLNSDAKCKVSNCNKGGWVNYQLRLL